MGADQSNGALLEPEVDARKIIPGTTFLEKTEADSQSGTEIPSSFPGPTVNFKATVVEHYSPAQLAAATELYPTLCDLINRAFDKPHNAEGRVVIANRRFQYDKQFLDELGNGLGTVTFVLRYSDTREPIATATAKRYTAPVTIVSHGNSSSKSQNQVSPWKRMSPLPEDTEAWELSTMAVEGTLQGQGLANYLMELAEDHAKQTFRAAAFQAVASGPSKLVMMITTDKNANKAFYARRGFTENYETHHEIGTLGSETGFTVIHMSKSIPLTEEVTA